MSPWVQPADSAPLAVLFARQTLLPLPPLPVRPTPPEPLLPPSLSCAFTTFCLISCYLRFPLPPPRPWGCIFALTVLRPLKFNAFKWKTLSSCPTKLLLFLLSFLYCLMAPDGQEENPGRAGLAFWFTSPCPALCFQVLSPSLSMSSLHPRPRPCFPLASPLL